MNVWADKFPGDGDFAGERQDYAERWVLVFNP